MPRRNIMLSSRHDKILLATAKKLDISMVATVERALEALEEKEAQRDREVGK